MAVAVSRRDPPVKSLAPTSRLAMVFRELAINGKRDWKNWIVFCQHAADEGDEEMQRVVECYNGLKKRERASATPEFVADLANVAANDLAAEVFRSYLAYSNDASNLIAAAGLPDVVRTSVRVAKTKEGVQDRKMQFDHAAFLPQRQGGGIHVNASANAENKSATIVSAPELESMEKNTLRMTRILKGELTEQVSVASDSPRSVPALGASE